MFFFFLCLVLLCDHSQVVFALNAMMEIPDQFQAIKKLRILSKEGLKAAKGRPGGVELAKGAKQEDVCNSVLQRDGEGVAWICCNRLLSVGQPVWRVCVFSSRSVCVTADRQVFPSPDPQGQWWRHGILKHVSCCPLTSRS